MTFPIARMSLIGLTTAMLSLGFLPQAGADQQMIGKVMRAKTPVVGDRAGVHRELKADLPIFADEAVTTIILESDSRR